MGLGVGFTPFETRTDVIARVARHAEDIGFDRVDVAEGWTHDSLIVLTELAARTSRIALGTSIISVWGRTPATMALGAAGLQRSSGGRFSLGIGAGSPPLAEGFHGLRWERPLARMRDTLVAVRALLAGERLPEPAPGARALLWLRARSGSRVSSPTGGRPFCGHDRASDRGGNFCGRVRQDPTRPRPRRRRSVSRWRWDLTRRGPDGSPRGGCRRTSRAWARCIRACWASASA